MSGTHMLELGGPMHYLYLGSHAGGQLDVAYEEAAIDECAALFESFCVTRAIGMFRGNREETLIFHIASCDSPLVTELAGRMRERFNQDGVGVVRPTMRGGIYSRVVRSA
jgi:hypothetical protein